MPTQVEGADGLQYVPPESSGLQSVQAPLEVAHARSYPNNTKPKNGGWNTGYGPGYPLERKRSDEEKVPVNNHGNNEDSRNRTICGLQRRAAIIIIVLIVIIIVGAVGGGVGGALASKNNNSSGSGASPTPLPATAASNAPQGTKSAQSSTTSASSKTRSTSASTTSTSSTIPIGVLTAPSFSGDYSGSFDSTVTYTAATPGSTKGVSFIDCPSSNNTIYTSSTGAVFTKKCYTDILGATDINHVTLPSLDRCIDACALWNTVTSNNNRCVSVSYSGNITSALGLEGPGNNCHLKDGAGGITASHWDVAAAILSQ